MFNADASRTVDVGLPLPCDRSAAGIASNKIHELKSQLISFVNHRSFGTRD
jgi:hypothetical protein